MRAKHWLCLWRTRHGLTHNQRLLLQLGEKSDCHAEHLFAISGGIATLHLEARKQSLVPSHLQGPYLANFLERWLFMTIKLHHMFTTQVKERQIYHLVVAILLDLTLHNKLDKMASIFI